MKSLYLFMLAFLLTYHPSFAQETESSEKENALTLSGSVDVYYRYNLKGDFDSAPGTSFANLPGFSLGMANLNLSKEFKSTGIVGDFVLGPRGEDATFLSPILRPGGNSSIVNQLYVYWNLSESFTLTLGNFNTFLGYEVISPVDNFNYSTSYLFSYGPFSHTGVKMDYTASNGFSFMVGVFNSTDATEYNPTNDYAVGGQVGYTFGTGSIYLNTLVSSDFYQFDITGGIDFTDKLYWGINASTAKDAFYGAATYIKYGATSDLDIGTRLEYFKDKGVEAIGLDASVVDLSLSANYRVGNLTFIPEFRIDMSSENIFSDDTQMNDSLSSVILAAVYSF